MSTLEERYQNYVDQMESMGLPYECFDTKQVTLLARKESS